MGLRVGGEPDEVGSDSIRHAAEALPPLNMTSGPVEVSEAVIDAQRSIITSPHIGDFWSLHDEVLGRLARVLDTNGTVLAFPGAIRAGLAVALENIIGPGTRVLAVSNGYWGDLIADMCREQGADTIDLRLPALLPVDPDAVRDALKRHGPVDVVTIVHVETNAGIINPIDVVGDIVRESDALYFVDTACSAGAMPIDTDKNGIDLGVTGSHKCLAGLPGLAIVSVSEKAWRYVARNPRRPGYFNLRNIFNQTVTRPEPPAYTQPPALFAALNTALRELEANGLDAWYEKHRAVGRSFRNAMRNLGMAMVPDHHSPSLSEQPEHVYSDTVQAVAYSKGVDDIKFRARLAEEHGVHVIGNLNEWKGRSFRLGLMSPPQLDPANVDRSIAAIRVTAASLQPGN